MIAALRASLADRYEFGPQLGTGGMATVYRAHDLKHDRDVAIKVLHPEQTAMVAASRFLQEIRVVAQLNHPSIVPLHDSGEAAGLLYYVMPCIEGESLRQRLEREHQLPVEEALRITHEIADGLSYAHELGVIHRDIKPENILLSHHHAQLADFGIARAVADAGSGTLTRTGLFVGTPLYTSPEQASGVHAVDARADQYSLACVLYEMLAGEPPFTGPTQQAVLAKHALETRPSVRTVRDTVPRHVDEAVQRALAKVPVDRFASVAQFAGALAAAPPEERARDSVEYRRRRRLTAAAIGVALTAVAAVLLVPAGSPLREALVKPAAAAYAGAPAWSAWTDVSGESFFVFAATDSALVVHASGSDSIYRYDGRRWSGVGIPPELRPRPFAGPLLRPRLLAMRPYPDVRLQGHEYWWIDISGTGRAPERLPDLGPGRVLPRWWTDGQEVVLWANGVDRLDGAQWSRETTPTAGMLAALWGRDFEHRAAILKAVPDSLMVFDGISWQMVDVLPARSPLVPGYTSGVLLRDGTSVVLGEACDSAACESLILQQDTFGGAWLRLDIPEGIGLPLRQPAEAVDECGAASFALTGAGGESRQDYYVWGMWSRCERLPVRRDYNGCPPEWPCVWHVVEGRLEPVTELTGRVLHGVQPAAGAWFALVQDGTLWRRVERRWRPVDRVPGLPDRRVAASARVIAAGAAHGLSYQPSSSDTISAFMVAPLRIRGPAGTVDVGAVTIRDSTIALLARDGTVHRSTCTIVSDADGERSLECPPPALLGRGAAISAIAVLPSGDVIGVAAREVTRWHEGRAIRERLPEAALADTLWGVSVGADGTAMVVGNRSILQRNADGSWTRLRGLPATAEKGRHFALLPDGDVAIAGRWLRLWSARTATPPVATLLEPWLGRAEISALHVLGDGRLVVGFAGVNAPAAGGWIEVWAAPPRAGRSERVELPLNVNVTSLADDGLRLLVAGRGGSMAIPLAALPFAGSSRPD